MRVLTAILIKITPTKTVVRFFLNKIYCSYVLLFSYLCTVHQLTLFKKLFEKWCVSNFHTDRQIKIELLTNKLLLYRNFILCFKKKLLFFLIARIWSFKTILFKFLLITQIKPFIIRHFIFGVNFRTAINNVYNKLIMV